MTYNEKIEFNFPENILKKAVKVLTVSQNAKTVAF